MYQPSPVSRYGLLWYRCRIHVCFFHGHRDYDGLSSGSGLIPHTSFYLCLCLISSQIYALTNSSPRGAAPRSPFVCRNCSLNRHTVKIFDYTRFTTSRWQIELPFLKERFIVDGCHSSLQKFDPACYARASVPLSLSLWVFVYVHLNVNLLVKQK